jgi:hypothetical protein
MKKYSRGQSPSNRLFDAITLLETLQPTSAEAISVMKNARHVLRGVLSDLNEAEMATVLAELEPHPVCSGCGNELLWTRQARKCCRLAVETQRATFGK